MSYANFTIAPATLVSSEVITSGKYTNLQAEFSIKLGEEQLPVYVNIYGNMVEETQARLTNAKENATFLLTGDILLLKADHPKIAPFDPEVNAAALIYMAQPQIIQCKPDSFANQIILAGNSNRAPEVKHAKNGMTIASGAYGIYAGKQGDRKIYSYVNFTLFQKTAENFSNLIRANSSAILIGTLKADKSKDDVIYIKMTANKFQKIGYEQNNSSAPASDNGYPVEFVAAPKAQSWDNDPF